MKGRNRRCQPSHEVGKGTEGMGAGAAVTKISTDEWKEIAGVIFGKEMGAVADVEGAPTEGIGLGRVK